MLICLILLFALLIYLKIDRVIHFYIILRGITTLKCRIFDERTHEFIEKIIGEMQTGEAFGELAILENRNRAATVICKSKCLFASLNKIDYQNILGFFLS